MNTQKQRNRKDNTHHALLRRIEQRQLSALETLVEIEKTEQRGFYERVPDVKRLHLKKDKVYTFSRTTLTNNVMLNSTTASTALAFAPALSNLPNSAEFVNLFEQYRIIQATFIFVPLYSGAVANPLYTWFDPDDDSLPTGTAEGLQSQTLRMSSSGSFVERTYTPQVSQGSVANGTGVFTGYSAPNPNVWMDTDSPSNKYYGIKAVIPANTNIANAVPLYSVEANVIIQCRRPK
jgi:hypothetical protein